MDSDGKTTDDVIRKAEAAIAQAEEFLLPPEEEVYVIRVGAKEMLIGAVLISGGILLIIGGAYYIKSKIEERKVDRWLHRGERIALRLAQLTIQQQQQMTKENNDG